MMRTKRIQSRGWLFGLIKILPDDDKTGGVFIGIEVPDDDVIVDGNDTSEIFNSFNDFLTCLILASTTSANFLHKM